MIFFIKKIFKNTFINNSLLCFIAFLVLLYSIFIENHKPCPLCISQQISLLSVFIFSVVAIFFAKSKNKQSFFYIIILVAVSFGIYYSANQVYLQYFTGPTSTISNTCNFDLNPIILDVTKSITGAIESCSEITEQIAGLSLACYSLILFIFLFIYNSIFLIIININKSHKKV